MAAKNPPLIPGTAAVPGIPATGALGAFAGRAGAGADQGRRDRAGARVAAGTAAGATGGGGAGAAAAGHAAVPGLPAGTLAIEPAPGNADLAPLASPRAVTPVTTPAATPASTPSPTGSSPAGRQYATPGTRDQQAFISLVAPGAVAAQQRYGVPAAVTIAQAIEESAWGRSSLAAQYHNLFGIKGTGPAGSVSLPTSEYQGGHWVTVDAQFRVVPQRR